MQFYLLWPLILSLMADYMPGRRSWIIACIIGGLSLLCAVLMQGSYATASFYLLPARMFEFVIGTALLWIPSPPTNETGKSIADSSVLGGAAMIVLSVLLYTTQTPYPSFYALLPCVGTALILYGAPFSTLKPVVGNPLTAYMGRISYELYLFHWVVIVFYKYVDSGKTTSRDHWIMLTATAALSMVTYHGLSFPLRYGFKSTRRQRLGFVLACIAVAFMLGGIGLSMSVSGWAWRLPPETRLFAADPETFHATQFGGIGYRENQLLTLGDPSQPQQFLLLGDSFAGQYTGALDEFLKRHHTAAYLFHVNACLFLPHTTAQMLGQATDACNGAFERMLPVLANNHLPVVLAQSWSSYKDSIRNANGSTVVFSKDTNAPYYAFLIQQIEQLRLTLAGHKLVIVGISPGIAEQKSLARCFEVPNYISTHCAENSAAREIDRQNGQEFNRAAANYVALHPEVGFINPRTSMCINGLCYAISDSRIFYSDFSHFTKDGAMRVIEQYRNLLLALHP